MNSRTCAYCLAMDGSVHPLTDVMATHPRCRCAQIPVTRSWSELGFPGVKETRPTRKSGAEVFASWPATEQRAVLGPGKYALYAQGRLDLADLIGQRRDPQWGPVGYERSLADILGGQEQRKAG